MLKIKKDVFDKIVSHMKKEYPNEACGIIAGKGGVENQFIALKNTHESPTSYAMDPFDLLKVDKFLRAEGLEMLAIVHSHVATKAYPSKRDIEQATYPDASYVIISLSDMDSPDVRSYKIQDRNIEEEELKIE